MHQPIQGHVHGPLHEKKVERARTLSTTNIFENLDFLIFIFMFVAVFGHCLVKNREFRLDQA